ncbi:uncharacterized protein isoform X1 [Leptinotarsa decemlineata]|uniref:uncharacterized protein isoform X1 n=1 Tax=Leptinotarsa decemlineata TaxID=7539 RepID=UPI003D307081
MFHSTRELFPQLIALIILFSSSQAEDYSEREDIYYKLREPYFSKTQVTRIYLGRDASGCLCNEYDKILTICFGRESCTTLPIELNVTSEEVSILQTLISHIGPGDLDNIRQVKKLRIEGNFNLSSIAPRVFENFVKLENLSISFNLFLTALHEDTFVGLINLRRLSLIKNGFTNINYITHALSTSTVPALTELSINENKFSNIEEKTFAPLNNSKLQELDLTFCQVEYLHPDSLVYLKKLRVLRLGENTFNLSTLTQFMNSTLKAGLPLEILDLPSTGLRKTLPKDVLEIIAKSNITDLNLGRNQFDFIPSGGFPWMPNLKTLDLTGIMIADIEEDAFANLPNLRTLLLGENKLTCLPEGVVLPALNRLDLQRNSRESGLFPFDISNGVFSEMKQLRYLNLNFDAIYHLSNDSFIGLENLEMLYLKNSSVFHIRAGTFKNLNKLSFLNLENNLFVRNNYPNGMYPDVFIGLHNLEVLLLAGNGITYFSLEGNPLVHLKSLKYLGLEKNYIATISPTQFDPLVSLKTVSLSYNSIRFWEEPIFRNSSRLRSLILDHNKISRITPAMMGDFSNLTELNLSFNSIICDCMYFLYFHNWLEEMQSTSLLKILSVAEASCINPYRNQTVYAIAEYLEAAQNGTIYCDTEKLYVKILPFGILFLVFALSAVLAYYYRWHLKYWMFLTKLYLSRKGRIKRSSSNSVTEYRYDVFVSYSNEDRNFVIRLVTMLENYEPFLKLCVYERDFQIGSFISESVLDCVTNSRKVLLVVSNHYVKSHWCRWESHIAEHHRLYFGDQTSEYVDDALVLIKLGPIDKGNLTPMLKYLLKTKIYLGWDADEKKQGVFWKKLRDTLAPPPSVIETTHM